jgi:integrase/recombinase XerC
MLTSGRCDREVGSTATYIKADLSEVAAAVAALTGEPHPLAPTDAGP